MKAFPAKTRLSSELVESFSLAYLSPRYDNPQPVPPFHREGWDIYCSMVPAAALAAPRGHAKSTGFTHAYGLANVCWRVESYIILIGASEEKAIEHLGDISFELRDNDELRRDFLIKGFLQDTKSDIIVECHDGWQFRITARGAEQKIRGTKWRGKRPGLIIGDDLEDDEQVENRERREKFRKWFFRAAKQALRKGGRIRVHGTILHKDALLARLIRNPQWKSKRYQAHKGYNDFSGILWPEQYNEARLRSIRAEFAAEGDSAGYSQEYLNDPREDENRYLHPSWFHEIAAERKDQFCVRAVGCDFAVATHDKANRTSFTVGEKYLDNHRAVVDQRVGRWDTKEWVDVIFELEEEWEPEYWFPEDGVIWQAVWPTLQEEMRKRDVYPNFVPVKRVKDKPASGRPWQKEMRAGVWEFAKDNDWYAEYQEECLDFTVGVEALLDDQFDSTVNLALGLVQMHMEEGDERTDEERAFDREALSYLRQNDGRSEVTGY